MTRRNGGGGVGYKVLYTFDVDGKIFYQNYLGLLAEQGKLIGISKRETVSLQVKFDIKLFNSKISIFLSLLDRASF